MPNFLDSNVSPYLVRVKVAGGNFRAFCVTHLKVPCALERLKAVGSSIESWQLVVLSRHICVNYWTSSVIDERNGRAIYAG